MNAESLDRLEKAVRGEPLCREMKYRILAFCRTRRELSEIEDEIAAMPQFKHAAQNQYHMIRSLEAAGGLRRFGFDEDGKEVVESGQEGSEGEADRPVARTVFETTPEGDAFVESYAPASRFDRLLRNEPQRRGAFFDVLAYCSQKPRSYSDLKRLLGSQGPTGGPLGEGVPRTHPSVFIDRLERSGLLEWDGGWKTSEEGVELLKKQAG